jgi:hypothetical protein
LTGLLLESKATRHRCRRCGYVGAEEPRPDCRYSYIRRLKTSTAKPKTTTV